MPSRLQKLDPSLLKVLLEYLTSVVLVRRLTRVVGRFEESGLLLITFAVHLQETFGTVPEGLNGLHIGDVGREQSIAMVATFESGSSDCSKSVDILFESFSNLERSIVIGLHLVGALTYTKDPVTN